MKYRNIRLAALVLAAAACAALLFACVEARKVADLLNKLGAAGKQPDPVVELTPQQGWTTHKDGPVIMAGDHRDKGLWNDPCVLKEGGGYVMYLTSSTVEPFKPPVLPFRAVSKDGVNWTLDPKKPLMDASGTPFVSVETPSVVKLDGVYHMYFTGIYPEGSNPPMGIGHATSSDGVNWKKDPKPVLSATGSASGWDGYLVGEPGAVVFHGKVYLYFSAVGARQGGDPPQLQSIGLAVSDDGWRFGGQEAVLQQSALYPAGKGYTGYSTPFAFVHGDVMHIIHDVAYFNSGADPQWQQVALQHAWSRDGRTGFVQDGAPIFTRGSFDWTKGEILAPSAMVDGGKLKLWFAGHVPPSDLGPLIKRGIKGREFGIGYATTDIGMLSAPAGK